VSTRVGTPVAGETLAGRYRLDECLAEYPRTHRTLWRGTDEVLNRQVAIELRVPGGPGAEEFLTAAMTVARIVHPAVIGVYDAVDEGDRAYVVREWIRGSSLASQVRDTPIAPERAAAVARSVAEGLAALHAAGATHGNVNPNSVLIEADDTVTLTDLRLTVESSRGADIRAVGAVLYAALTGRWPTEVPAPQPGLPDAVRADGKVCSPRQVRAGIPAYLDALTMDLLDPSLSPPSAMELATDLRRFDVEDASMTALYEAQEDDEPHRSRWMKVVLPLVSVLLVALVGWIIGTSIIPGPVKPFPSSDDPTNPDASGRTAVLPVSAVKILDPGGDGAELDGAALAADGNSATAWKTDVYTRPNFGDIAGKVGMGVRVDLGEAKSVRKVTVRLGSAGATLELRRGSGGDDPEAYRTVATREDADQSVTFTVPAGDSDRYGLVWITSLPPKNDGYGIEVQEIVVSG
jgi:hypothetical protein